MATSKPQHGEVRSEFSTKDGVYRNIKASEHCRPSGHPLIGKELSNVQVSFVSCKDKDGQKEWVVFNAAKELYFYPYEGVGKVPDLKRPIDKRVYKSPTVPVCHDFNLISRSTSKLDLIVGFSTGPLQHINPLDRQSICAYNEDGSIDPTRVTCVKWVPASENKFVSSHRSGNVFVWTTEHTGKTSGQLNYSLHKEIQDATISTVKPKSKSPVLFRWTVGHGAITSFAFSPDVSHIAIVSQDGFLRVYDFEKQELYGRMRSYYGALLCVCWSPDGRYVVTGGEDDFINVWSFDHRRVVARGEGHRSYVNAVAFDPYTTVLPEQRLTASSRFSLCSSDDGIPSAPLSAQSRTSIEHSSATGSPSLGGMHSESGDRGREAMVAYRLGSVGQDTQLCLWDLSGDVLRLRKPFLRNRSRLSRQASRPQSIPELPHSPSLDRKVPPASEQQLGDVQTTECNSSGVLESSTNHVAHGDAGVRRNSSAKSAQEPSGDQQLNSKLLSASKGGNSKEASPSATSEHSSEKDDVKKAKKQRSRGDKKVRLVKDPVKKVMRFVGGMGGGGQPYRREVAAFETCNSDDIAPKMHEVNSVEPLVAKKISSERLTALVFREDCIVTASQEGFIHTWARPGVTLPPDVDTAHRPTASSSVPSNPPGLNSPRPGGEVPLKNTTV